MKISSKSQEFSNRIYVIVGAAGHLGRALSCELAESGAQLVLIDSNKEGLMELCTSLQNRFDSNPEYFVCDIEQSRNRRRTLSIVSSKHPRINGVVNCAAFVGDSQLSGWNVRFEDQSVESWRRAIEVNLTSVFEICQKLIPSLRRAENACIVNISSIYGEKAPQWHLYEGTSLSNPAAYSVSKGGLNQLTRWLATTLAPSIRVNAIVAGGIQRNQPVIFRKRYCKGVPLGRMAIEKDIVGPILFLLSENSGYITGETLHVDGGRGIW